MDKMKKFKIIYFTIVAAIWVAYIYYLFRDMDLIDLFMLGGVLGALLSTIYIPIIFVIIYYLIKLGIKKYKKSKGALVDYIVILILLIVVPIALVTIFKTVENHVDDNYKLENQALFEPYVDTGFIHNNELYYFQRKEISKGTAESILKMDDSTHNSIVCKKMYVGTSTHYDTFVYNNEVYYDYSAMDEIGKTNLETCDTKKVVDGTFALSSNNGRDYIYTIKGLDNPIISKVNLKNMKVIENRNLHYQFSSNILIDHDTFNVYSTEEPDIFLGTEPEYVLKNDEKLVQVDKGARVLTLTKNYLFVYTKDNIIKIDLRDNTTKYISNDYIDERNNKLPKYIPSDTNDYYFIYGKTINRFDEELDEFEEVINIDSKDKEEVEIQDSFHVNDKVIFTGYRITTEGYDGKLIIVYNTKDETVKYYENVPVHNFDNQDYYIYDGEKIIKIE